MTENPTRCPAAHPDDRRPCEGPEIVRVVEPSRGAANGCVLHGAVCGRSRDDVPARCRCGGWSVRGFPAGR